MAELRTMAQDITKNTGDIENYSKEFIELQSQLNQISKEKFNGISLFGVQVLRQYPGECLILVLRVLEVHNIPLEPYIDYSRQWSTESGSVSINVINFQFMLSIGTTAPTVAGGSGIDLGNINGSNTGGATEIYCRLH